MAHVTILWGEHPLEVNAGIHARRVVEILRKKYGHEVTVKKIPLRETYYYVIQSLAKGKITPKDAVERLEKISDWIQLIKENLPRKSGHFLFNFHGTPSEYWSEHADFEKNPSDFRIGRRGEIRFLCGPREWSENGYAVEVPETRKKFPQKVSAVNAKAVEQIQQIKPDYKLNPLMYMGSEIPVSLEKQRAQQSRFQSPEISEKIAKYIDEEIIAQERNPSNPRWKKTSY